MMPDEPEPSEYRESRSRAMRYVLEIAAVVAIAAAVGGVIGYCTGDYQLGNVAAQIIGLLTYALYVLWVRDIPLVARKVVHTCSTLCIISLVLWIWSIPPPPRPPPPEDELPAIEKVDNLGNSRAEVSVKPQGGGGYVTIVYRPVGVPESDPWNNEAPQLVSKSGEHLKFTILVTDDRYTIVPIGTRAPDGFTDQEMSKMRAGKFGQLPHGEPYSYPLD